MLKGYNRQSIVKTLGSTQTVIYNDMKYLTERSKEYVYDMAKEYVYDMAKGTHVLMYQRAIEGVGLILETAWNKFNDPKVPEKQKLGYLHLAKGCHESMFNFTANGVSVLALKNIIERANSLGIDHTPLEDININVSERVSK